MICGGAEASITPLGVAGFAAMRALSQRNDDPARASRPWDVGRDGFVVGEGAGILVLEEIGSAGRRGAPILAELAGYGMSADAHHLTAPPEDGDGVARVMQAALDDADRGAGDIQYLNAHATSTPLGDAAEARAIERVFGGHAPARGQLDQVDDRPPPRRRRRARGRPDGAGDRDQIAPPTINLDHPDAEIASTSCRTGPAHRDRAAMTNSFGFGGTNASLIFKRARRRSTGSRPPGALTGQFAGPGEPL